MKNHLHDHLTLEEVRSLELAARRARAVELLRLVRSGAAGLNALAERLAHAVHGEGRIGHA